MPLLRRVSQQHWLRRRLKREGRSEFTWRSMVVGRLCIEDSLGPRMLRRHSDGINLVVFTLDLYRGTRLVLLSGIWLRGALRHSQHVRILQKETSVVTLTSCNRRLSISWMCCSILPLSRPIAPSCLAPSRLRASFIYRLRHIPSAPRTLPTACCAILLGIQKTNTNTHVPRQITSKGC